MNKPIVQSPGKLKKKIKSSMLNMKHPTVPVFSRCCLFCIFTLSNGELLNCISVFCQMAEVTDRIWSPGVRGCTVKGDLLHRLLPLCDSSRHVFTRLIFKGCHLIPGVTVIHPRERHQCLIEKGLPPPDQCWMNYWGDDEIGLTLSLPESTVGPTHLESSREKRDSSG